MGLVLLPVLARRYAYFGDPLSPVLERFKPHPDALVVGFAQYLRDFGAEDSAHPGLTLLLKCFVPVHPGEFQVCLGVGAAAIVAAAPWRAPASRLYALLAATCALGVGLLSQVSGRYLIEDYLFGVASLLSAPAAWHRRLLPLIGLQGVAVLAGAVVGAAVLAPGSLTRSLRERVQMDHASEYSEAAWAKPFISDADVVVYEPRGNLFYGGQLIAVNVPNNVDLALRGEFLRSLARDRHATLYIAAHDVDENDPLWGCVVGRVAVSPPLTLGTRNPFGTAHEIYRIYIQKLDVAAASCGSASPPEPRGARAPP
jgi:hypothetical protein